MSALAPDGNVGALAGLLGYAVVAALAVLQARDVPVQRQLTRHHVVLHIPEIQHQCQTYWLNNFLGLRIRWIRISFENWIRTALE